NLFAKDLGSYGKENCKVYRPLYLSLSNKKFSKIDFGELSSNSYSKAVNYALNRLDKKPDLVYAHFLYNARAVVDYTFKFSIPLFVSTGESSFKRYFNKNKYNLK